MKHLLRPTPLAFLSAFLLLASTTTAARPLAPLQSEPLPSAREVIERHVTAAKLRPSLETTRSMHVEGSFSLPAMGMKGAMETWSAKPDLRYASIEMGAAGTALTGYDGKHAWMTHPMIGARIFSDTELLQAKLEAGYDSPLKPEGNYESMRTVERTTFEGKDCFKVELVAKPLENMDAEKTRAARTTNEYYEVATGLLIGSEGRQEGEMAQGPVTSVFSDYKDFGGQLQPTKTLVRASGQEYIISIDSVEFDTATESTFAPPAEIQKLIEAAAAKPAPAKEAPKAQ